MAVTIKDVAKRAGVTIGTVSRVLNNKKWVSEESRQKVLKAIQELRYKPQAHARRLRQKEAFVWGVIAPHHASVFRSGFFTGILAGLEEVAAERKYRLMIYPLSDAARAHLTYQRIIGDGSCDGMFVLNAWSTDASIRELMESAVPFVLVNGKITGQEALPYVGVDNFGGMQKAVEHLVSLGHRKIAIINGRMTTTNAMERFQAFQETLAKHGLDFIPEWAGDGDFEEQGGYRACKKILKASHRPSAIVCCSDVMALGAARALREEGVRIPETLSLVGFDDMEEAAYFDPPLTTVAFSAEEIGRLAAEKMLAILQNEGLKEKTSRVEGKLLVRGSTGPAVF